MIKNMISVLACALTIAFSSTGHAACGKLVATSMSISESERVELILDSELFKDSDKWSISEGKDPPLSVSEASRIAGKWLDDSNGGSGINDVREISLVKLGCSRMENYWYYLVEYSLGSDLFRRQNWFAIRFGGQVVAPVKVSISK